MINYREIHLIRNNRSKRIKIKKILINQLIKSKLKNNRKKFSTKNICHFNNIQ